MKKAQKVLEQNGLSDKEARTYLALLSSVEASPAEIAKKSRLKRPTVYLMLEQLMGLGYVSKVKRGRSNLYRALNPYALLDDRHSKFKALEKVIPELARLNKDAMATPQMTVFEGPQGIKRIMEDTLTCSTEIYGWADMQAIAFGDFSNYWEEYLQQRVEIGIWLRILLSDDSIAREMQARGKDDLREAYLIPRAEFPFKNEIKIYDDKLAIISPADMVGVIIENANIAETQRSIFRYCFGAAKRALYSIK